MFRVFICLNLISVQYIAELLKYNCCAKSLSNRVVFVYILSFVFCCIISSRYIILQNHLDWFVKKLFQRINRFFYLFFLLFYILSLFYKFTGELLFILAVYLNSIVIVLKNNKKLFQTFP